MGQPLIRCPRCNAGSERCREEYQGMDGTTIGTNAIATRAGAKVGMLTTKGARDTIHIARGLSRWTSLSEAETKHMATTIKPAPLVPKKLIREIRERVDYSGSEVVPLNIELAQTGGGPVR